VGSSFNLETVAKRKIPIPCRKSKSSHPVRSLVATLTELPLLLKGECNRYLIKTCLSEIYIRNLYIYIVCCVHVCV
jgi:hypothetical protein